MKPNSAEGNRPVFAARGLAGKIANLLGRPENEGWVFTRCFQDARIFGVGAGGRGGCTSPRADTWQSVLLLLAMAAGAGPREAVRDAVLFGSLPFLEIRRYDIRPDGESFVVEPVDAAAAPPSFALGLGEIINWHRLGYQPDAVPLAIRFGVNGGFQFGEIWLGSPPRETDAGTPVVVIRHGAQLEAPPSAPYQIYRFAEISGAILRDIAKLLGSGKSGGGVALSDDDENAETDAEELPMAAAPTEHTPQESV